jgi:predicted phosphodiesterase
MRNLCYYRGFFFIKIKGRFGEFTMENFLSVEEKAAKCYEYFHTNSISNRQQLRDCWKQKQIPGVRSNFIEDIFSDFMRDNKLKQKKAQQIQNNTKNCKTFVLGDIHIPYHDELSLAPVFDCIIDNQPQYLVLLGDILDCYAISKFLKTPDRLRNLQYEIDIFYKMMRNLKKHLPNTEIHFVLGNHEARVQRLQKENSGIYGLDALSYEKLFRLDDLNIVFHPIKVIINNCIFYHGDVVRKDPGASAKQEMIQHNMQTGITGHTHRLCTLYNTYDEETNFWCENGCLCRLDPEYLTDPAKANWQQGFTVVETIDNHNTCTQVCIHNHTFKYNGKIYK